MLEALAALKRGCSVGQNSQQAESAARVGLVAPSAHPVLAGVWRVYLCVNVPLTCPVHAGNPTGAADAETHFSVEIVSPKFEGLRLLARHRLVYDALGNLDSLGIHALSIKAHAPGEKSAAS